jgi:hypothetical protein
MAEHSVEHILQHLIQGKDPKTGIAIESGSPILEENVREALSSVLDAVKDYRTYQVRRMKLPANTGKPWLKTEDKILVENFELGVSIEQQAKNLQRTRGAVYARLVKLGKIEVD